MANNTMGNTNNTNRQGGRGSQNNQGNQGTAGTQRQAGRKDSEMEDNTRQQGSSNTNRDMDTD